MLLQTINYSVFSPRLPIRPIARLFERGVRVSVLVRGVHVQESPFMQGSINHAKKCRVTNSKCMLSPTNSLQVMCSHIMICRGSMQIQESMKGGTVYI